MFYTKGKQGRNAAVEVTIHNKGAVANAELDHITQAQLLAALGKEHPDYDWTAHVERDFGYWIAYGSIV